MRTTILGLQVLGGSGPALVGLACSLKHPLPCEEASRGRWREFKKPCSAPDGAMKRLLFFCSLTVPPSAFQASKSPDDAITSVLQREPSTLAWADFKPCTCLFKYVTLAPLQRLEVMNGLGPQFKLH